MFRIQVFGDDFEKLRKANVSVMSVHLSVRPSVSTEQLDRHLTDFHGVSYVIIFRKPGEKSQVLLERGLNN